MTQDSETPTPYSLMRSDKEAIGAIVTVAAELEYILTIALFSIAKIEPWTGLVILGKMNASSKRAHLLTMLENEDQAEKLRKYESILPEIENFYDHRNLVAHGVPCGAFGDRLGFWVTSGIMGVDDEDVTFLVRRIKFSALPKIARLGERLCLETREIFDVAPFHEFAPYRQGEKPQSAKSRRRARKREG